MTDESLKPQSVQWKQLFVASFGFGAGIAIAVICVAAAILWYTSRPAKVPPWNQNAVTVKYADHYVTTSQRPVFTFRYTLENHTDGDYELPTGDSLYKILPEGKGLERDVSLKWAGGTFLPAGQKVNVGIQIDHEYNEAYPYEQRDNGEQLNAFMNRRLSEIEGFVVLDQVKRYEIRFPKPPDAKP